MSLERMDDFFAARADGYDEHMLANVVGAREAYDEAAARLPEGIRSLLDLGCGTGLELEPIFARFPALAVTGVDMTRAMLEKLRAKYPDKALELVCDSYFHAELGESRFDAAVAVETLHHFPAEQKIGLYARVLRALRPGGVFLDCDYVADSDEDEARWFAENARLRREAGVAPDEFYHYDTPLTLAHEREALLRAGFARVDTGWQIGGTAILAAHKA